MQSGAPVPRGPSCLPLTTAGGMYSTRCRFLTCSVSKRFFDYHRQGHRRRIPDWSDIRALANNPHFEVESHTVTHPWDLRENLVTWIDGKVPGRARPKCFMSCASPRSPWSANSVARFPIWLGLWLVQRCHDQNGKRQGYEALLTIEPGFNTVGGNLAEIRRIQVDGACDMATFEQMLRDGRMAICGPGRRGQFAHSPYPAT